VGAGFLTRVRAVSRREHGFSLVETVVAIGTIFVSLTALAYTGTAGFRYIALARERQAANQIANRLMEETRGLAFEKVAQGMSLSEVQAEANDAAGRIVECPPGSGTYRLEGCSGEEIVKTQNLQPVYPLVPHVSPGANGQGAFGRAEGYPVDYTWRTYVTRCAARTNPPSANECATDDPTETPLRVIVIVSWSAGAGAGAATSIQNQSLFSAASGCGVSDATHPFTAPCQPYLSGQAVAPAGKIDVGNTDTGGVGVSGTTFASGSLLLTGAESDLDIEQISRVQGSILQTGALLTVTGSEPRASGGGGPSSAADGDPSGGLPPYSTTGAYVGQAGTLSTSDINPESASGPSVVFTHAAGDDGRSVSANAAGAMVSIPGQSGTVVSTCPPDASENDGLPCGGALIRQAGTAEAYTILNYGAFGADFRKTTFVQVSGVSSGDDTTTVADIDGGAIHEGVRRTIGAVSVGGLPANVDAGLPGGWRGSFLTLSGYADEADAYAGDSATLPSAQVDGGTITYWEDGGYTTVLYCSATRDWREGSCSGTVVSTVTIDTHLTVLVGGQEVTVALDGSAELPIATTTGTNPVGATQAEATAATVSAPLLGAFKYTVCTGDVTTCVDSSRLADVTISLDLGAIGATANYQPPPPTHA